MLQIYLLQQLNVSVTTPLNVFIYLFPTVIEIVKSIHNFHFTSIIAFSGRMQNECLKCRMTGARQVLNFILWLLSIMQIVKVSIRMAEGNGKTNHAKSPQLY